MAAMKIGYGAVATFGIEYSQSQVEKISKYPIRVILFDPENEAQKQAEKLCSDLSVFPGKTIRLVLSEDIDKASCHTIQVIKRLAQL